MTDRKGAIERATRAIELPKGADRLILEAEEMAPNVNRRATVEVEFPSEGVHQAQLVVEQVARWVGLLEHWYEDSDTQTEGSEEKALESGPQPAAHRGHRLVRPEPLPSPGFCIR